MTAKELAEFILNLPEDFQNKTVSVCNCDGQFVDLVEEDMNNISVYDHFYILSTQKDRK